MTDSNSTIYGEIEKARKKLLDMSLRNSLLNFKHSSSSMRHCRIVDANVNYVFSRLLKGDKFLLKHLPEIPTEPLDEQTPEFLKALELARISDEIYLTRLEELEENDDDNLKEEIIRDLKDRIRVKLGLPKRCEPSYTAFRWAKEIGINPDYDNKTSIENPNRENKTELQTLFFEDEFNKKIRNIQRTIQSDNDEKGANTFYIAIGFLEWTDAQNSTNYMQAPLLLIRLNFCKNQEKKVKNKKNTKDEEINYYIEAADINIQANLPLEKKLGQFNLSLPKFSGEDTPDSYFDKVENAIKSQKGWRVRRYITVGRFIFSRIAMYADLDTQKNWGNLENIVKGSAISKIFHRKHDNHETIDYDIDKAKEALESILISPADTSQHTTIIEANKGKSMVIQGPPGTGKSQTITNLIANALYRGEKVLFVSEKKAALDVVYRRLKNVEVQIDDKMVNLEDFCFELHSDRANKKNVVQNLKSSYGKYFSRNFNIPTVSTHKLELLKNKKNQLREYYDFLQTPIDNIDCESIYSQTIGSKVTVCDIIWKIKEIENILKDDAINFFSSKLSDPDKISPARLREIHQELDKLCLAHTAYIDSFQNTPNTFYFDFNNIKSSDVDNIFKKTHHLLYFIDQKAPFIKEQLSDFLLPEYLNIDSILKLNSLVKSVQKLRNTLKIDYTLLPFLNSKEKIEQLEQLLEDIKNFARYKREVNKNVSANDSVSFCKKCKENKLIYQRLNDYSLNFEKYTTNDFINLKQNLSSFRNNLKALFYAAEILFDNKSYSSNYLFLTVNILELISKVSYNSFKYLNNQITHSPSILIILNSLLNDKRLVSSLTSELSIIKDIDSIDIEKFQDQYRKTINHGLLSSFSLDYWINKFSINSLFKTKVSSNEKNNYLNKLLKLLTLKKNISNNRDYKDFLTYSIEDIENILQAGQLYQGLLTLSFSDLGDCTTKLGDFLKNIDIDKISELTCCINSFKSFSFNIIELENCFTNCSNLEDYDRTINSIIMNINEYLECFSSKFMSDLNFMEINSFLNNCQKVCDYHHEINRKIRLLGSSEILKKLNTPKGIIEIRNTNDYAKNLLVNSLKSDIRTRLFSDENEQIIDNLDKQLISVLPDIEQIKSFLSELYSQIKIKYDNYVPHSKSLFSLSFSDYSNILNDFLKLKNYAYCITNYTYLRKQVLNKEYSGIIDIIDSQKIPYKILTNCFDYVFYISLLNKYTNEEWDNFQKEKFSKICDEIRNLDQQIYDEYQKMLIASLMKNISSHKNDENISSFASEKIELSYIQTMNLNKLKSLREIIFRCGNAIQLMKPCFLMSPLSVAQYLTPEKIDFDLLIIDEASQMYFEEALGSLLRCKQYVIVGDEQQLPPTSFFQKSMLDDDYEDEDNDNISLGNRSVLETCHPYFSNYELLWHYRSRDDSLINFSNYSFYDEVLNIFPSIIDPQEKKKYESGIEYHYDSEATYKSGKKQNEKEAKNIINAIRHFVREHPDKSLGVVAMNSSQQTLLMHEKDILLDEDSEFRKYVNTWSEPDKQEPFFIKNLENVQGDERDYIFISTVYGPETPGGKVAQRFGPINGTYGPRRLNVLITRAKYGIKLFTSLKSKDVNDNSTSSKGIHYFNKYLAYAETGKLETSEPTNHAPDSPFEVAVKSVLEKYGYQVDAQVGCKGFRIDLAVKHPKNTALYALGIECDGAPYHSSKSARDRDCIRQSILEEAGWNIYRIWSTDWYHNTDYEIQKLLEYVGKISKKDINITKRSFLSQTFNNEASKKKTALIKPDNNISTFIQEDLFDYAEKTPNPQYKTIVELNDTVICMKNDQEITYKIVSGASDPSKGLLNQYTQIATELLDAEEGDEVLVNLPNGECYLTVKEIIKPSHN